MASSTQTNDCKKQASQQVYCPAYTPDYRVVGGQCGGEGLGLVANRFIAKGETILKDSIEFLFSDVEDGDFLRLHNHHLANAARSDDEGPVPLLHPITKDMLLRTHGVPSIMEDGKCETWRLETPWMLMNHSCDPNVIDSSHKEPEGEAIAARDICEGEELTYDYTHQLYCERHNFTCLCGAERCRGIFAGFQALTDAQKKATMPRVSDYIKTRDQGVEYVKQQPVFDRQGARTDNCLRLVFPGPSCADADIEIKTNAETGQYGLYAMRSFEPGEEVYSYWTEEWADNGTACIDMVAATQLRKSDLPEGTTVQMQPQDCAFVDCQNQKRFSGYDMFRNHSCDPNIVYNHKAEGEDDEWRTAYAVKSIQEGELLTLDFNTIWWDHSLSTTAGVCHCGAENCASTTQGFKFVPKDAQERLLSMSWKRQVGDFSHRGEALAPHIQMRMNAQCIEDDQSELGLQLEETESCGYTSYSEEDEEDSLQDDEKGSLQGGLLVKTERLAHEAMAIGVAKMLL